jgi:kynurenine formamidase
MRLVELNHVIEPGMVTYKGLPGPLVCDFLSREASRGNYVAGTEFQIGRIDMVGNTGTYLDTPFHRYADGADLAGVALEQVTQLPGLVVRCAGPAVGPGAFAGLNLTGCAVLIHTGWDRHWGTEAYLTGHPHLTEAAALLLRDAGVALVGIDSHNIDDTAGNARPVHTVLLGAGIPIVEHLTRLGALPDAGFIFNAPPPRIRGMGTFPVRAHALVE